MTTTEAVKTHAFPRTMPALSSKLGLNLEKLEVEMGKIHRITVFYQGKVRAVLVPYEGTDLSQIGAMRTWLKAVPHDDAVAFFGKALFAHLMELCLPSPF